jgi:hypothetical protein
MREVLGIETKTLEFGGICQSGKLLRFPEIAIARGANMSFDGWADREQVNFFNGVRVVMANGRGTAGKASCENCFFHQNLLCAIESPEPCATFRPAHPDGLRPPGQLRFVFRQERRLQVAWAFPSASEQVALHA